MITLATLLLGQALAVGSGQSMADGARQAPARADTPRPVLLAQRVRDDESKGTPPSAGQRPSTATAKEAPGKGPVSPTGEQGSPGRTGGSERGTTGPSGTAAVNPSTATARTTTGGSGEDKAQTGAGATTGKPKHPGAGIPEGASKDGPRRSPRGSADVPTIDKQIATQSPTAEDASGGVVPAKKKKRSMHSATENAADGKPAATGKATGPDGK